MKRKNKFYVTGDAIQACKPPEVMRFDRGLLPAAAAKDPQMEMLCRLCLGETLCRTRSRQRS